MLTIITSLQGRVSIHSRDFCLLDEFRSERPLWLGI